MLINRAEAKRVISFNRDEIVRSLRAPVSHESPEVERLCIAMRASWARDCARECHRAAIALRYL
jgi:hypothetical protein